MHTNFTARVVALSIGGIFAVLGGAIITAAMFDSGPRMQAPAAILAVAGLAFLFAGFSVAINSLNVSSTRIRVQRLLGVMAALALLTVAIWAFAAPGESKSSFSLLFWKR